MAKKSKIARNQQREIVVQRFREQRAALKAVIKNPATSPEKRAAAMLALQKQPRDASATRLRNRDQVDGRPRGVYRKFGLSRVRLREQAHRGELPGITKSSW